MADNGMGRIMPCHSSTHWTTDIAHDAVRRRRRRCVMLRGQQGKRGRSSLAALRKGVKITATWSEHDVRYRVITVQTLDLGEYPGLVDF